LRRSGLSRLSANILKSLNGGSGRTGRHDVVVAMSVRNALKGGGFESRGWRKSGNLCDTAAVADNEYYYSQSRYVLSFAKMQHWKSDLTGFANTPMFRMVMEACGQQRHSCSRLTIRKQPQAPLTDRPYLYRLSLIASLR
jgi:hypothetical protein